PIGCPQLPPAWPTLDELIGTAGITADNVADSLLASTASRPGNPGFAGHVFTLHAELEGMRLTAVFERLLEGWKAQGYQLVAMRTLYESLQALVLPRCEAQLGAVPGRSGKLLTQGGEFLAGIDLAAAA